MIYFLLLFLFVTTAQAMIPEPPELVEQSRARMALISFFENQTMPLVQQPNKSPRRKAFDFFVGHVAPYLDGKNKILFVLFGKPDCCFLAKVLADDQNNPIIDISFGSKQTCKDAKTNLEIREGKIFLKDLCVTDNGSLPISAHEEFSDDQVKKFLLVPKQPLNGQPQYVMRMNGELILVRRFGKKVEKNSRNCVRFQGEKDCGVL